MDGGDYPWNSRFPAPSRRYQSRSEMYLGGDGIVEEEVVEDEYKQELMCPFCAEEFDIVGLCCHVDEHHPVHLKQGVCPICAKRVGLDMVSHFTIQHGNILKVQRRRRSRRGGPSSMFSMLRKELRDASKQSLFGGHSYTFSSSNPDPDPLLSSLIYSSPIVEEPGVVEADSSALSKFIKLSADDSAVKRVEQPRLSEKDQEEKARKCKFVHGLLLSTILDDAL